MKAPHLVSNFSYEDHLTYWLHGQMYSLEWSMKHRWVPKFLRRKIVRCFIRKTLAVISRDLEPTDHPSSFGWDIAFGENRDVVRPENINTDACFNNAWNEYLRRT